MLLFWLFGLYAAESAINLRNCVYLCVLWPYATSPARGVMQSVTGLYRVDAELEESDHRDVTRSRRELY